MNTLGSLFDGSGGFPLAGALSGIVPLWASEIEPYPIAVTASRFPRMQHLGNVAQVDGGEIPPVDVITFGSPCQDMSVAGKRAGMKHEGKGDGTTTRSGLFYEAIRIIREMRENTNGQCPTFAVWENVPGAFTSNSGEDFRCVLEELAKICEGGCAIPRPADGKWNHAGEIVGEGYSIAWRLFDAQYWGVPQRRKRIYLVADFAGGRAGTILFEREGVRRGSQAGRTPQEGASTDAAGSAGGGGVTGRVIYALQGNGIDRADTAGCNGCGWRVDVSYTLNTIDRPAICFKPGQGAKARSMGESDKAAPTLASEAGGNAVPGVRYPNVFHTLSARNARNPESAQTPNCACYDARGNGDGTHCPTLTGDHENRVTDYTAICVMAHGQTNAEIARDICPTLNCNCEQPIVVHGVDCRNGVIDAGKAHALQAKVNGGQSLNCTPCALSNGKPPRKYIIRRLTPLECCRLQGFPDGWGIPDRKDELTDAETDFWEGVRKTYAEANGKVYKPMKRESLVKWYNGLRTDSAEYRMWGNGIALPNAAYVLAGVAEALADGTGGNEKRERLRF